MEPVQSVQMDIYQSNTYRKELSRLHFLDVSRVQERQQVNNPQSYIFVIQQFQVATRSTSPGMTTVFHTWPYGRFIEIQINRRRKKLHRRNQGYNFLGGSFGNRDNVRAPIQFRRESQPQHLKRCFLLKNRPIHFHINYTSVFRPVKRN